MPSIKEAPTPTAVPQKSTKKSEEGSVRENAETGRLKWPRLTSCSFSSPAAPKKDKKVSGVFVRSQTITPVKSTAVQLKVNAIFDELGVRMFGGYGARVE